MEEKYTVCLWPGAGYITFAIEVLASSEEDALTKAVERALDEDIFIYGFEDTEENVNDLLWFYAKEYKEYDDYFEFFTSYLNYHYIGDLNYFVHMDNTKIERGWNLYENNIPLKEETYSIVRFFRDLEKESEIIKTGLTLEEAQEHCSKEETTTMEWFDGFQKE